MALILLLSLLAVAAHEVAHALVARLFGVRVTAVWIGLPPRFRTVGRVRGVRIEIGKLPLGPGVEVDHGAFQLLSAPRRAAFYLAGPLTSFAVAVPLWAAGAPLAAAISLIVGAVNLLPLPPLDGALALLGCLRVGPNRLAHWSRIGNRILLAVSGLAVAASAISWLRTSYLG